MNALYVNGEPQQVEAATVAELLRGLGLDLSRRGLAVALNGSVVTRTAWPSTPLAAGDRLEIVRAVSGG